MRQRQRHALTASAVLLLLAGGLGGALKLASREARETRVAAEHAHEYPGNAYDEQSRAGRETPASRGHARAPHRGAAALDPRRQAPTQPEHAPEASRPPAFANTSRDETPLSTATLYLAELPPTALVRLQGSDAEAPRALRAWRSDPEGAVLLAEGRSLADGSLAFPPVVVPQDGLEIIITPADRRPDQAPPGAVRWAPPRDPRAPWVRAARHQGNETLLRVTPLETAGAIVVADAEGEIFGRHPLPPTFSAPQRRLELLVSPAEGETSVLVAHEFADGRRSPWRPVSTLEESSR